MSRNKKYASGLIVLTFIYFVIEIIVNFSIYKQLSGSSDVFIAESMELWGKIITGLGLGLLVTRYLLSKYSRNTYLTFLVCCAITIPVSFLLQNLLINYVVNSATAEDKNKALLVVATHGTLVPFYTTNHWKRELVWTTKNSFIYPFGRMRSDKYVNFWESREREFTLISECAQKTSESMGIVKGVDKAFFPYLSLLKNIDESTYKQAIIDYYMCAFEYDRYFDEHTRSTLNQTEIIFKMYFDFYYIADNKYESYKNHTGHLKEAKKVADQQWRAAMNGFFGHKTTIPPGLAGLKFTSHPDVKRWYIEKTGITDLYPGDKNFREDLLKKIEGDLPYSVIPAYKSETEEPSSQYLELTDEQIDEQGKKAYKAVIMPFIAMGFSALFLLLNIILIVNTYIQKKLRSILGINYSSEEKKVKILPYDMYIKLHIFTGKLGLNATQMVWLNEFLHDPARSVKRILITKGFLVVALAGFLFYPSFKDEGVYDELNNSNFKSSAKWVYYHETNLVYIWDKITDGVHSFNAEKEQQEFLQQKRRDEGGVLFDLHYGTYMGEPISKEESQKIRDAMITSKEDQQKALLELAMSDALAIEHLTMPTYRGELMTTKKQVEEVRKEIERKRQEYRGEL